MELYSECCDGKPLGYVEAHMQDLFGICSECKEWSVLYSDADDDSIDWVDELEYIREHE